jgi:hypothetical protein
VLASRQRRRRSPVPAQGSALGESKDHSDETLKELAKYRYGAIRKRLGHHSDHASRQRTLSEFDNWFVFFSQGGALGWNWRTPSALALPQTF